MAIHTSAIVYKRGIPNGYTNFFFVAQANNSIPVPISKYLRYNSLYNKNVVNSVSRSNTWPWRQ